MPERCKHELLPGQCADCLGHSSIEVQVLAERAQLLHQPGWFAAKFGGTCRLCGEPFVPDTAIRRQAGNAGYIAECCALAPHAERRGPHRCPGGCGRDVPHHVYACRGCWSRLPHELRRPISTHYGRDDAKHAAAMIAAGEWYRQHAGVRT
jgi:hypothetical protein